MKRSSSETSPSSISDEDQKPDITPSKSPKKSPSKVSPANAKKEQSKPENGEWDQDKRAIFMDLIIAAGYKAINLDDVANTLGMGKKQLVNQLTAGRKGSFREKAVMAVKGS